MIQKNELRIGNVIGWKDGFGKLVIGKVYELHEESVAIGPKQPLDDGGTGQGFMRYEGIEPVVITPDLLTKLGFNSESPNDDSIVYCLDNFYIDWTTLQPLDFGVPILNYKIVHIHQLQNLYFVWTKQELTIKAP